MQIHDIHATLLDVLPCAMHTLLNHLQWPYLVAISYTLEGLQTNWSNTSILMSLLPTRNMC